MISEIAEHGKYLAVAGFKNIRIKDVKGFLEAVQRAGKGVCVQFFDARLIAGWEHLFFAALNALKAFESGVNVSNSLAIEILLFASAQRQIKRAVELLGVKPETSAAAVLVMAETPQGVTEALKTLSGLVPGERDDSLLELTNEKMEAIKGFFKISDLEFQAKLGGEGLEKRALTDLVIEHMALLVTQK